jgi:hypothetical protein
MYELNINLKYKLIYIYMKLTMNFTNSQNNPRPQAVNFVSSQSVASSFNMQSIMSMRISSCKSCGK